MWWQPSFRDTLFYVPVHCERREKWLDATVLVRSRQRRWRAKGEPASATNEMSKELTVLAERLGKAVVGCSHMGGPASYSFSSQPQRQLPWQQTFPLRFCDNKAQIPCILPQLFLCYLWSHISCVSQTLSVLCVFIAPPLLSRGVDVGATYIKLIVDERRV